MTEQNFLGVLMDRGWSETQAKAVLSLVGNDLRPWGADGKASSWRSDQLHDWCSSNSHQDPTSLEGQLGFLTHELKGVFGKLWNKMAEATTVEAAKKAVAPYFDKLMEKKNDIAS